MSLLNLKYWILETGKLESKSGVEILETWNLNCSSNWRIRETTREKFCKNGRGDTLGCELSEFILITEMSSTIVATALRMGAALWSHSASTYVLSYYGSKWSIGGGRDSAKSCSGSHHTDLTETPKATQRIPSLLKLARRKISAYSAPGPDMRANFYRTIFCRLCRDYVIESVKNKGFLWSFSANKEIFVDHEALNMRNARGRSISRLFLSPSLPLPYN
jgi:hypothetical protein